jgi:hypothetical protein
MTSCSTNKKQMVLLPLLAMPATLSCNRSRSSNSDVVECVNDFRDSIKTADFVWS